MKKTGEIDGLLFVIVSVAVATSDGILPRLPRRRGGQGLVLATRAR